MQFCDKCGVRIPDGSAFCPECGEKQEETAPAVAKERPMLKSNKRYAIYMFIIAAVMIFSGLSFFGGKISAAHIGFLIFSVPFILMGISFLKPIPTGAKWITSPLNKAALVAFAVFIIYIPASIVISNGQTAERVSDTSPAVTSKSLSRTDEIKTKLENSLKSHALTDYCEFVQVIDKSSSISVGISMQWYESYSFIAAICVATDCLNEIKSDYGIEDISMMLFTPDAKYQATWSTVDLNKGKLSDTQKGFDDYYTLEKAKELYGYEGLLEN